jgi:hypothetical protein
VAYADTGRMSASRASSPGINSKRTHERFKHDQITWSGMDVLLSEQDRRKVANYSLAEQSSMQEEIKNLIQVQTMNIETLNRRSGVLAAYADDEEDYADEFDDEFDAAPLPRPARSTPSRPSPAATPARGADLFVKPATAPSVLSRDEMLRMHAGRWKTYTVCPPEWDMTPTEYRHAVSRCSPDHVSMTQFINGLGVAILAAIGAIQGVGILRGAVNFEWTTTIVLALTFVGALTGLWMETASKHKARGRLSLMDPRLCVEVSDPDVDASLRALMAPLDDADKEDPVLATAEGRRPRLSAAYETARRAQAATEGAEAPHEMPTDEVAERRRRWTVVLDRFEAVDTTWADLLTDPLAVLEHSRLLDVKNEATAAFIEAHGHARDLIGARTRDATDLTPPPLETLREAETAVRALATAWEDAQVRAQRAGYEWMPEADRRRARRATTFLLTAADETLTVEARLNAAEKALELMRAIETVPVPQPILRELAEAKALAIEA